MKKLAYLETDEEAERCHYHFETPRHSYYFFGFWVIWVVIAVYFAQKFDYGNGFVPWDNCDKTKPWAPVARYFIDKEQYKSELRKVAKFRSENQLWISNNFTRIEYGTVELSYCKEEEPLICDKMYERAIVNIESEPGIKVKSILRTIELNPYVASCLRCMILLTMSFRMVMAIIRTSDVLIGRRQPLPIFIQFVLSSSPILTCLQSISMFWITVFHTEFDRAIGKWHPYAYFFVGIFTFLEMFCDLLHDSFDTRTAMLKSKKFYIKCSSFVIFCFAYPHVVLSWLQFFKSKRCQAYVPIFDGILEYSCAISIVVFHFVNSLMPFHMFIAPAVADTQDVSSYPPDVYMPLFLFEKTKSNSNTVIYENLDGIGNNK